MNALFFSVDGCLSFQQNLTEKDACVGGSVANVDDYCDTGYEGPCECVFAIILANYLDQLLPQLRETSCFFKYPNSY